MTDRFRMFAAAICWAAWAAGASASAPAAPASRNVLVTQNASTRPASQPAWRIGQLLPLAGLTDIDAHPARLDEEVGDKMLIVACLKAQQQLSLDVLADLRSERAMLQARGAEVAAVVADGTNQADWWGAVQEHHIDLPLFFDERQTLVKAAALKVLPATIVLDRHRRITSVVFLHRPSYLRELTLRVEETAAGKTDELVQRRQAAQLRERHVAEIEQLVRAGMSGEALTAIDALRARQPDRCATRLLLGAALTELGEPGRAVQEYHAALKIEPSSLRAKLGLAIGRARSGQIAQAAQLVAEVTDPLPDAWVAHGELGAACRRAERLDEAIRHFTRCFERAPKLPLLHGVGGAWVGTRAPALCVTDLDGRTTDPPAVTSANTPTVVLFWATWSDASLAALRRLQALTQQCSTAPASQPSYPPDQESGRLAIVAVNVERPWITRDDRRAVRAATEHLKLKFDTWLDIGLRTLSRYDVAAVPTLLLLDGNGLVVARLAGLDNQGAGEFLSRLTAQMKALAATQAAGTFSLPASQTTGQPTTAPAQAVQTALALTPAMMYLDMARQLCLHGNQEMAVASLGESIRLDPREPAPHALLAEILLQDDQAPQALEPARQAAALSSHQPAASTLLARCLTAQGRLADGIERLRAILTAHPGFGPAYAALAEAMLHQHRPREALAQAQHACRLNPFDFRSTLVKADALRAVGAAREAAETYETGFRLILARTYNELRSRRRR